MLIFLVCCLGSCTNRNEMPDRSYKTADEVPLEPVSSALGTYRSNEEYLASKKLQHYFELLALEKKHSGFAPEINLQIKKLTLDSTLMPNYPVDFKVSGIVQLHDAKEISDSVQRITLFFDLKVGGETQKDSVHAFLIRNRVRLEGRPEIANKVLFSAIEDMAE